MLRLTPILLAATLLGCGGTPRPLDESPASGPAAQDTNARLLAISGFAGPEAVRYDAEQDVYFVANFNGEIDGDGNGFVSRVRPDGTIDALRFMTGTEAAPFHAGRGMVLAGDTLWVVDAGGVHAFDRTAGAHLAFVDLSGYEPAFLNDIARGPDGALYVTETGGPRLYRIAGEAATVALTDSLITMSNGITWDPEAGAFALVMWGESGDVHMWRPGAARAERRTSTSGGNLDGVEIVDGQLLIASQADSSLHVVGGNGDRISIRLPGRPADIGVDTRRGRVLVPYVGLDRVDVWSLARR